MIGYLKGKVLGSTVKKVLVQPTGLGLGYEVNFYEMVNPGSEIELYIFHNITDSDQNLWGFRTLAQREYFEMLKSVNKVGASKAYALLSTLGLDEITMAITTNSPNMLSKAPGIGKKMAEQIILSLRDKIKDLGQGFEFKGQESQADSSVDASLFEEAAMALDSLGYKDSQVAGLIRKSLQAGAKSSQEVIKSVLREM
ncbi:MAG: hypothetical protein CME65_11655 [Halobacteriovoraceae bacterium]|nr:hypothetical protein [Halobacteriovoraceae bacterium]|tara:strand:+ start:13285 stop:13878 length:594 start_codon:yes stop_codon:yes gene_type:complete